MNAHWITSMLGIGLVGFLTGCEPALLRPEADGSYFRASIDGSITSDYEGRGQFLLGTDSRRPAAPPMFSLFSVGTGASSNQTFQLFRPGADLPEVGVYRLGPSVGPEGGDLQAAFSLTGRGGTTLEMYSAYEGELEIVLADAERMEGTFRMSAYRSGQALGNGAFMSALRSPDSPTIEVTGSFSAIFTRSLRPPWMP